MIERRTASGALLPIHRGVYGVGHRPASREGVYMAAVLACGPEAVLAGAAAAYVLGILKSQAAPRAQVVALTARRIPGVVVRRGRGGIARLDYGQARGIPVTSPARTLVDLAGALRADQLARCVHEAMVLHHLTPQSVEKALARNPTAPGARKLRRVLRGDERVTLSRLERRFLALLRDAGLPLPETNARAGGRCVDCRWAAQRLTVELDGYRFHASRFAWEQDRRREREAYARGDQFRRFTWEDVVERPGPILRELRALLKRPT
jgi:very-short-patch-repair endonuclease